MRPIHGNIGLQAYQKFVGYYLKTIVPHHLYGTFIFRQSIIKRDLVFRQSRLLPLFSGLSDIDCKFNKFLYDFSGSQRIGVVPRYRVFQPFGKARVWTMLFRLLERMPSFRSFRKDSRAKFFWRS